MYDDIVKFIELYKEVSNEEIKTSLRAIRKSKNLTPKLIEEKTGIPAKNYSQFEKLSNKYKPSVETLIRLCNVMDICILELLDK